MGRWVSHVFLPQARAAAAFLNLVVGEGICGQSIQGIYVLFARNHLRSGLTHIGTG